MGEHDLFENKAVKADLSPMIDLVFLLLIFFIVTANLVTYPKDSRVQVSKASDAKVPDDTTHRIVINILQDGTLVDTEKRVLSLSALTKVMEQAKSKSVKTSLHLRVDARADYRFVKRASRASADGGVTKVIFSTHVK